MKINNSTGDENEVTLDTEPKLECFCGHTSRKEAHTYAHTCTYMHTYIHTQ